MSAGGHRLLRSLFRSAGRWVAGHLRARLPKNPSRDHSVLTCCEVGRPESRLVQEEALTEMTLVLTTGPANLQQAVSRSLVLRGRWETRAYPLPAGYVWGITTLLPQEPLRPASPVTPSITDRSRPRSDGSILPLAHPRLRAQLLGWLVDEVNRPSFRRRFELFWRARRGLSAMAVIRISLIHRNRCKKMWLLSR